MSHIIDDEGRLSAWEVISEKSDLLANAFLTWYPGHGIELLKAFLQKGNMSKETQNFPWKLTVKKRR